MTSQSDLLSRISLIAPNDTIERLSVAAEPLPAGAWAKKLAPYREPKTARSILEIVITAAPLLTIWAIAWGLHAMGLWWAALLLTLPAALFLVRLFMIQHDCGHGSFLPSKMANDWLGRILGIFTLTPYEYWRLSHANHHATSGNLDRRELGAIELLTVEEYDALPPLRRLGYRLYRHPLVLFGLGPAFVFFIQQRIPIGLMKTGWRPWVSTLGTTGAMVAVFGGMVWLIGNAPILWVHALTMLIASSIGVWLFYVQHQFEGVAWARGDTWRAQEGALHGSSHYDLPPFFRWMTANIGIHHVHHLSSRIPFYHLGQVMRDFPELAGVSKLKFVDSLKCARLALWDEPNQRLVTFREARRIVQRAQG